MPVTLQDVAEKAGLSPSTASRVLNGKSEKYRISEASEQRVLDAARELGYKPNLLARSLRRQETLSVGLVVPDLSNPFFAHVTSSIQRSAHQAGYNLIVCSTDERLKLEVEHIDLLLSKRVDGLIVMPVGQEYRHLQRLLDEGKPLVLLDRHFEELDACCVTVDNSRAAFEATEHLIEHGHERIGLVQGLPHTSTNRDRKQGYVDALQKHGLPVDDRLTAGRDFGAQSGYEAAGRLLGADEPPSALFALGERLTLGTLRAISEAGLQVPEDISLVSFDDVDFAPFVAGSLTAVAQPREAMGEAAVDVLIDLMQNSPKEDHAGGPEDRQKPSRPVLQPHLIVRGSVAAPASPPSVPAGRMDRVGSAS